jgi:hypothetical protein
LSRRAYRITRRTGQSSFVPVAHVSRVRVEVCAGLEVAIVELEIEMTGL